MIDKILECKQLGNEGQIHYILNLLKRNSCATEDLRTACHNKQYDFAFSFEGLLLLLEWLKIVKRKKDNISLNTNIDIAFTNDGKVPQQFYQLLFEQLSNDGVLRDFLNQDNVSCFAKDELILINNDLVDFKFSPFRNFLINLHFFIPDKLLENQFSINDEYKKLFLSVVIPLIESSQHGNVTLEEMKDRQRVQEQQGKEAEEFVLSFEQSRLRHHINIDNVKIISEDNVSAGYDIQSYQDGQAIIINRFIEVKSFSGNESFYWSKNEIDISKKKENQYCLYLVDRDKMKKKGYKPIIIQNPYNNILLNEEEWDKRVEKYYFQLKANKIQTV